MIYYFWRTPLVVFVLICDLLLRRHRVPALLVSSVCSSALQPRHLSVTACRSEGRLGGHEDPGAAQTWPRHPQQTQRRLSVQGREGSAWQTPGLVKERGIKSTDCKSWLDARIYPSLSIPAGGPSPKALQPPPHPQDAPEGPALQEQTQTATSQRKDAQRSPEAQRDQRAPREEGEQQPTLQSQCSSSISLLRSEHLEPQVKCVFTSHHYNVVVTDTEHCFSWLIPIRWWPCSTLWAQSTTTRGRKATRHSTPNTRSSCSRRRNRRRPSWRDRRKPVKNCTASWARKTRRSRGPVWRGRPRMTNSLYLDSWLWLSCLVCSLDCCVSYVVFHNFARFICILFCCIDIENQL